MLELLIGIGAVVGGGVLALAPDGSILQMPLDMLRGTPFANYLLPGLLLCLVVGASNVAAGVLTLRRSRKAPVAGIFGGFALVVWIGSQIALIGYRNPVQAVYLAAGVATCVGAALLTSRK